MKVQELMVTEVVCCSPETTFQDIALMMEGYDCGAVPLIDERKHPVGIVTDRDIALEAALRKKPLWKLQGSDISMNQILHCCQPGDSVEHALSIMEHWEIRRLPVINRYNQLCGIISLGDIVSVTGIGTGPDQQIETWETIDFLRHVSAHHTPHQAVISR